MENTRGEADILILPSAYDINQVNSTANNNGSQIIGVKPVDFSRPSNENDQKLFQHFGGYRYYRDVNGEIQACRQGQTGTYAPNSPVIEEGVLKMRARSVNQLNFSHDFTNQTGGWNTLAEVTQSNQNNPFYGKNIEGISGYDAYYNSQWNIEYPSVLTPHWVEKSQQYGLTHNMSFSMFVKDLNSNCDLLFSIENRNPDRDGTSFYDGQINGTAALIFKPTGDGGFMYHKGFDDLDFDLNDFKFANGIKIAKVVCEKYNNDWYRVGFVIQRRLEDPPQLKNITVAFAGIKVESLQTNGNYEENCRKLATRVRIGNTGNSLKLFTAAGRDFISVAHAQLEYNNINNIDYKQDVTDYSLKPTMSYTAKGQSSLTRRDRSYEENNNHTELYHIFIDRQARPNATNSLIFQGRGCSVWINLENEFRVINVVTYFFSRTFKIKDENIKIGFVKNNDLTLVNINGREFSVKPIETDAKRRKINAYFNFDLVEYQRIPRALSSEELKKAVTI